MNVGGKGSFVAGLRCSTTDHSPLSRRRVCRTRRLLIEGVKMHITTHIDTGEHVREHEGRDDPNSYA